VLAPVSSSSIIESDKGKEEEEEKKEVGSLLKDILQKCQGRTKGSGVVLEISR